MRTAHRYTIKDVTENGTVASLDLFVYQIADEF